MASTELDTREWARVPVKIRARFRPLDESSAAAAAESILARSTVWAPSGEAGLRELAVGASGPQTVLAQAILELAKEIARIRSRVLDTSGPMQAAEIGELSGGGGQMTTAALLETGARLELRFEDDDGAPPVLVIATVVHREGPPGGRYGFRFEAIHPSDRDRLVRFIYQVQRKALRSAHLEVRNPP